MRSSRPYRIINTTFGWCFLYVRRQGAGIPARAPRRTALSWPLLLVLALPSLGAGVDKDPFMERMNPRLKAYYDELVRDMPSSAALGVLSEADFARVVYIDPEAVSPGAGDSPGSPLHSWTEVNWTSGTAYLQKRGTTETLPTFLSPGAEPILMGAYGEGERPVLQTFWSEGGERAAIHMGTRGNITVRDMHVRAPNIACAIRLGFGGNITLFNNRLENTDRAVRGHSAGTGFRLIGNLIHNTERSGVWLQYHNADPNEVEIAWNHIFDVNTRWEDPYVPETIAAGDCVIINGSTHVHIHHNVFDRTLTGNKFSLIVNRYGASTTLVRGLIEHNYLTSPRHAGDGGAALYLEQASGWIVRYNVFDGDPVERRLRAIYNRSDDLAIYGNLFLRVGRITSLNPTTRIYHNVFHEPLEIVSEGGNSIVRNNIIDNRGGGFLTGASVFESNLLAMDPADGGGAGNIVGDALFVDVPKRDFRLSAGSPAINAGMRVPDISIVTDRLGMPIPQGAAPDIGAHEYAVVVEGAPTIPARVAARPMDREVRLRWDESDGAAAYKVLRVSGSGVPEVIATTEDTTYADTGLANGDICHYRIVAYNAMGASPNSVQVSATPQPVPTHWAGFEVLAGHWVNAEGWLGSLNVGAAPWSPWVFSETTQGWMHLPEEWVTVDGAWLFAPRVVDGVEHE